MTPLGDKPMESFLHVANDHDSVTRVSDIVARMYRNLQHAREAVLPPPSLSPSLSPPPPHLPSPRPRPVFVLVSTKRGRPARLPEVASI